MDKFKLQPKDLITNIDEFEIKYNPSDLVVDTTDLIYGQNRGIQAFEFGLNIDIKGYNIYFSGPTGVGKSMYIKKYLKDKAKEKGAPSDWIYVYNFQKKDEPFPIEMKAGEGREFALDMEKYVSYVSSSIKKTFSNSEIEKEKEKVQEEFEKIKDAEIAKLNNEIKDKGYAVKKSNEGVFMVPVVNGKVLNKDEYMLLPDSKKAELQTQAPYIQEKIFEMLTKLRENEIDNEKKILKWQETVANITVQQITKKLKEKYKHNLNIIKYLEDVGNDVVKNVNEFLVPEEKNVPNQMKIKVPKPWDNYKVNVFVDNSKINEAPVIMDLDYTFENIFGKLEYENNFGSLKTDYMKLRAGLLHKANGGYIVFEARDLLTTPLAYDTLKKALKTERLGIEAAPEQKMAMILSSIKPYPIPINLKVIIIGHDDVYEFLMNTDPDFKKLFKIKTEFDNESDKTQENIDKLTKFISSYIALQKLLPINEKAVKKIVLYAIMLAGEKDKITTKLADIGRLIGESSVWAKLDGKDEISEKYVDKAFEERKARIKKYDKKYIEMIQKGTLLIDTEGAKIGEINGLSVISIGDNAFGKPTKITANTYKGNSGIVNIEREINLSGPTHSKGVLIMQGYLGEKFAQDFPLSLSASICFEQTYSGVDGDSASSTEIYAMLSSLSGIPIKQEIAVTGSVNQKGEIQPIGGANEKITGFYEICKLRGLTGTQGVIIPRQNVNNLHLSKEIIDAIADNKFNIWAVSNIEEGIEILTGKKAGKKDENGKYEKDSIYSLVYDKLKKYSEKTETVKKNDKNENKKIKKQKNQKNKKSKK